MTLGEEGKQSAVISLNSGSPDTKDFAKQAAQLIFKVGPKEFKLWVDKEGNLRFGGDYIQITPSK